MFTLMLQKQSSNNFSCLFRKKNGQKLFVLKWKISWVKRKKGSVGSPKTYIFLILPYTHNWSPQWFTPGPMAQPMFATCCNSLIGCQTCVATWFATRPAPAPCPKCRSQEGDRHAVRGIHEAVHALRNIVDGEWDSGAQCWFIVV